MIKQRGEVNIVNLKKTLSQIRSNFGDSTCDL